MNISSLVLTTDPAFTDEVIRVLQQSSLCEYHTHKEGKIVVTIEGESVSDEIKLMNELGQIKHVFNVEMIYSYCEDELSSERENLEINGRMPDWLNDEHARAEDIKYSGRINL